MDDPKLSTGPAKEEGPGVCAECRYFDRFPHDWGAQGALGVGGLCLRAAMAEGRARAEWVGASGGCEKAWPVRAGTGDSKREEMQMASGKKGATDCAECRFSRELDGPTGLPGGWGEATHVCVWRRPGWRAMPMGGVPIHPAAMKQDPPCRCFKARAGARREAAE